MALNNYDVIFIDDEITIVDLFNQYVQYKYKSWNAAAFTDSYDLYRKIIGNEVAATIWIVDLMMPQKNGTEIAAAIARESMPGTLILGYTALDPYTLDSRSEYRGGLKYFYKIINKQESFTSLLELIDLWVKQGPPI
jgi:response regulator of citrate/malate metabolism